MGILKILIGALIIVFTIFIGLKILQAISKERFVDINTVGINPASGIPYDPTCPAGQYSTKTGGICTGDPAKTSSPRRPPGTPAWFQSTPGYNPPPPDYPLGPPDNTLKFPPLKPSLVPQPRPDIPPNPPISRQNSPSPSPPKPTNPNPPTPTPALAPAPNPVSPAPSSRDTGLGSELNQLNVSCPSGDKPKISFVRNTKNAIPGSVDINTLNGVKAANTKPLDSCPESSPAPAMSYGTGGGYNFNPDKDC